MVQAFVSFMIETISCKDTLKGLKLEFMLIKISKVGEAKATTNSKDIILRRHIEQGFNRS